MGGEYTASGREEKVWNPDSRFARESPASGVGEQESTPMSNCRIYPDICDFSDLHYRHCRTSASFYKVSSWKGWKRLFSVPSLESSEILSCDSDIGGWLDHDSRAKFSGWRPLLCGDNALLSRHRLCRVYKLFWSWFDSDIEDFSQILCRYTGRPKKMVHSDFFTPRTLWQPATIREQLRTHFWVILWIVHPLVPTFVFFWQTSPKSLRMRYLDKCWLSTDFYWFLQAFYWLSTDFYWLSTGLPLTSTGFYWLSTGPC